MPLSTDTYEDGDGNVWAFDPPYDDDPIDDWDDDDFVTNTKVDLGGGMVVPLKEVIEDD